MPVIKKEIILKGTTKEIFKRMSEYSFIQEMNSSANVCTKIIFKKPQLTNLKRSFIFLIRGD